jgi:hypothetical protein
MLSHSCAEFGVALRCTGGALVYLSTVAAALSLVRKLPGANAITQASRQGHLGFLVVAVGDHHGRHDALSLKTLHDRVGKCSRGVPGFHCLYLAHAVGHTEAGVFLRVLAAIFSGALPSFEHLLRGTRE